MNAFAFFHLHMPRQIVSKVKPSCNLTPGKKKEEKLRKQATKF